MPPADHVQAKKLVHHDDETLSKVVNRYEAMQAKPAVSRSKAGTPVAKAGKQEQVNTVKPSKPTDRADTPSAPKISGIPPKPVSLGSYFSALAEQSADDDDDRSKTHPVVKLRPLLILPGSLSWLSDHYWRRMKPIAL